MTYDDFMHKTRSTLNGLGNIYRIPLDYVLQTAGPPILLIIGAPRHPRQNNLQRLMKEKFLLKGPHKIKSPIPMTVYRISAANAQSEKSKILKRSAYLTGVSVLVGILLGSRSIFNASGTQFYLFIWISIFAILFTLILWRSLRRTSKFLSEAYSSFEITTDENTLTRKQKNTPDIQLGRAEVKRIEEHQGKGFRICTDESQRNIWVPSELDGYEQLKADMLALPGVGVTSKSHAWLRSYLIIGAMFFLIAVSLLTSNKWLAAGASLVLASYFLFVPIKQYRNPNLTTKGRRQLLWVAFIGICMLARAIILWRS